MVTNNEIARLVDTNDEWIRQRVGIVTRRFAKDDSVADMASEATRAALINSQVPAEEVDLVIVATTSNLNRSPSTSGRVIEKLRLAGATGFDVNAACSGFIHALETGKQLLRRIRSHRNSHRRRMDDRHYRLDRPLHLHPYWRRSWSGCTPRNSTRQPEPGHLGHRAWAR